MYYRCLAWPLQVRIGYVCPWTVPSSAEFQSVVDVGLIFIEIRWFQNSWRYYGTGNVSWNTVDSQGNASFLFKTMRDHYTLSSIDMNVKANVTNNICK